jgi:poly(glycerol-phosphate) alpha-glucosyltransferase
MIKSAHLTASVSRKGGGLFDAVLRLVQSQPQAGIETRVFGLWDEFTEADRQAWQPLAVAAFKPGWPRLIGHAPKLMEALNDFAPDICHTHGLWVYPSIAAKNYSRKNRRPYLVSPHGMLDPWALKNSRWKKVIAYRLFEQEHLRGARCLRALCASEANSIRNLQLKNDIVVIPNGIDLPTRLAPSEPPWKSYVEPWQKVMLFLSRIHPKKGLVNLLKAWAENRKSEIGNRESAEWVLVIAGWDQGGHEAELKCLATELGLAWVDVRAGISSAQQAVSNGPWSVVFLGPQFNEAKAACYHHCDAFVLPSFSEGLPMVVLEAWANSKPVILTPECNLPEGLSAGAALQAEATAAGLAGSLNELRRMTAAERVAMGSRARSLVVDRFTWSRVGKQLESVQQWILGGGTKPECLLDA